MPKICSEVGKAPEPIFPGLRATPTYAAVRSDSVRTRKLPSAATSQRRNRPFWPDGPASPRSIRPSKAWYLWSQKGRAVARSWSACRRTRSRSMSRPSSGRRGNFLLTKKSRSSYKPPVVWFS